MSQSWKEFNKEKNLFKSYYCAGCKQIKPCGKLTDWDSEWKSYCCHCYYQTQKAEAQEYSDYQQVYQQKVSEREANNKQYQLLKKYSGCKQCGSLAVDAYHLYRENKLICQPCRMRKEGSASGPISFLEKQKWYKKRWRINLTEWLENYGCLPVNYHCADEWLKDKKHLDNCQCLEKEAKEVYELFANSLKRNEEKIKKCACKTSSKPRTPYYDSDNYGYTYCGKCEAEIKGAGKHGVIKNRNNPSFWGLNIEEKVLCGKCLEKYREKMPPLRRAEFNRYRKVGRL